MRTSLSLVVAVVAVLAVTTPLSAAAPVLQVQKERAVDPTKYDPKEPLAAKLSLAKSAAALDDIAAFWMQTKEAPRDQRKTLTSCGSCHANYAYLMARPLLLAEFPTAVVDQTRQWMDQRIEDAISGKIRNGGLDETARFSPLEFVTIAAGLAIHDAQTGGRLQPMTRKALSRMWASQPGDGDWERLHMCSGVMSFPVAEFDRYYGATLAALAAGVAPEGYAQSDEAKAGLTKLRRFFQGKAAPNVHHQAMLLWASLRIDGLMTPAERAATIKSLLALQRADGGWSSATFNITPINRLQGRFPDPSSDGYGTGFVVYILRQAGLPATQPEVVRGVNWLKSHQRASGRWHTSHWLGDDETEGGIGTRGLSILNLGTAFSVMALHSCKETEGAAAKSVPPALAKEAGKAP